jgi:hypothetical protein
MKVNFLRNSFYILFWLLYLNHVFFQIWWFFFNFGPIFCLFLANLKNTLQFFLQFFNFKFLFFPYIFFYFFIFLFLFLFFKILFSLGWGFIHNWVIRGIQWMVCWWMLVHSGPKECEKHTHTHSPAFAHTSSLGEWRINNSVQSGAWVGG